MINSMLICKNFYVTDILQQASWQHKKATSHLWSFILKVCHLKKQMSLALAPNVMLIGLNRMEKKKKQVLIRFWLKDSDKPCYNSDLVHQWELWFLFAFNNKIIFNKSIGYFKFCHFAFKKFEITKGVSYWADNS